MKASESLQNDQSTATEDALLRAVDTTPAFIHTARPDGYLDYFNRGWLDFLGKSLEEVCDWPGAVLASTISNLRKRKVGNVKRDSLSTRSERPQGPLSDLERSEFYLREGERLAHMGSWSLRADGIFDYWSPETFVIFDFDPSEGIPTLTEWLAAVQPDDRDLLARTIDKMFREGVRCDVRYWVDHPKKGKRMMHSTGEPVLENGKVTRLIGNTLDITEQEELTQELRRREAYLAEAQRLSHTGSFGWDVLSGEIYWSDETFRIFELDPKTEVTIELIVQRTHPEDRQTVQQVIERASRDRTEFALEHRLLIPD